MKSKFQLLESKFPLIINLTRLNRPTGIWLLFLPCLFGILLSYKTNHKFDVLLVTTLFFAGAVIMRSAGCIINDIIDKKFDQKVARTQERPLASNEISIAVALVILAILLAAGLAILLQFNQLTRIIGIVMLILIIIYPLAKRITYFPQFFLGITFNSGILMASAAINNRLPLPIILLYISSIFWTLIYDTIYAYQDIEDDLKIGVKSSAIKFGANPQKILYSLTVLQIALLFAVGILSKLSLIYHFMIYLALFHLLCQIKSCDFTDAEKCLARFKSNIIVGSIIAMGIFLG